MKLKDMMKLIENNCMREILVFEDGATEYGSRIVLKAGVDYSSAKPFGDYEVSSITSCANHDFEGSTEDKEGDDTILMIKVEPRTKK